MRCPAAVEKTLIKTVCLVVESRPWLSALLWVSRSRAGTRVGRPPGPTPWPVRRTSSSGAPAGVCMCLFGHMRRYRWCLQASSSKACSGRSFHTFIHRVSRLMRPEHPQLTTRRRTRSEMTRWEERPSLRAASSLAASAGRGAPSFAAACRRQSSLDDTYGILVILLQASTFSSIDHDVVTSISHNWL